MACVRAPHVPLTDYYRTEEERQEPVAGGTRVIHAATFEPFDRWTGILVRLGRASLASRVEAHLRVLKERAEVAQRAEAAQRAVRTR